MATYIRLCLGVSILVAACGSDPAGTTSFAEGGSDGRADASAGTTDVSAGDAAEQAADGDAADDTGGGGPKLDVAGPDDPTGAQEVCTVDASGDAFGGCDYEAPPDSFDPEVQWSWTGPAELLGTKGSYGYALHWAITVAPVVANLTDDNDDGTIDLCDVPDVVFQATSYEIFPPGGAAASYFPATYVLDGATGVEHFRIEHDPQQDRATTDNALGDIDGDGIVEIVTPWGAYEHDGTPKWTFAPCPPNNGAIPMMGPPALADLDNDGDVEIMAGRALYDHEGSCVWHQAPPPDFTWAHTIATTTAADLDADGDLEVIFGEAAVHHDGTTYYDNDDVIEGDPHVADLDGDGLPEIVVAGWGSAVLEHDGTTKVAFGDLPPPIRDPSGFGAIVDLTADASVEIVSSGVKNDCAPTAEFDACGAWLALDGVGTLLWAAEHDDIASRLPGGTAFDFLGDGSSESISATAMAIYAHDADGMPVMTFDRSAGDSNSDFPIVVDVDNDGSAEIVLVSQWAVGIEEPTTPPLVVLRDADDRWVPARRIWNQHTYHVTNVREDGTIPEHEPPHWQHLNTFRAQAQIDAGGSACDPEG